MLFVVAVNRISRRQLHHQNALLLVEEAGSNKEFARIAGISEARASQIAGKKPTRWMKGDTLDLLEERFKKPLGWMDQIHLEIDSASISGKRIIQVIGVLERVGKEEDEWEMKTDKIGGVADFYTQDADVYALKIRGDWLQPRIRSGEYIVVEPSHPASPGDHVVVVLKTGRRMIKELRQILDDEFRFGSICGGGEPVTVAASEIDAVHRILSIALHKHSTKI